MGVNDSTEKRIPRTFGLDVLVKLTRKNEETSSFLREDPNGKYYHTTDQAALSNAVTKTMADYNIQLKIG